MDAEGYTDDQQPTPTVDITATSLELLKAIAVVTKNTEIDVLTYALELAQKKLPPTPKPPAKSTGGRRSAGQS